MKFNMAPPARRMVEQVMGVRPGEKVLLVTDCERPASITEALAHAVGRAGGRLAVMDMPPHRMGGIDPLPQVGAAMGASDVVILQVSFASFHTDTVRGALKKGARVIDMWGFEEEMMLAGGANVDYEELGRLTTRVAEIMTRGKEGRFTTPGGCDMRFSLEGRTCHPLCGVAHEPGSHCAIPTGEAAVSPVRGSAEGVLADPFSIEREDLGFVTEPMRMEVKGGEVVAIGGSPAADRFWRLIEETGPLARNVAEFAVGTNPNARKRATMREAKKAYGTCHMAFGDSQSLGGEVEVQLHVDMIFDDPTVWIDGEMIVQEGKIVL